MPPPAARDARQFSPEPERLLLLAGLMIVGTTVVGTAIHPRLGDYPFMALFALQGLLAWSATRAAEGCAPRRALLIVFAVAIAARCILLFDPPSLSTDAYRYVWDGRVQVAGVNPYRFVPGAPELAGLRDEAIWPHINRRDYAPTIYPPAAQILFLSVALVSDGLMAVKLALIAAEGVTAVVLIGLLRRLGRPPAGVVAYAWHPLALWEIAGNAHVDAAMVAAMMLGLWLAVARGRRVAGAAVLAAAALIKPFAVLALPAAWRPWDWRAPGAALAIGALLYLPYISVGTAVFGFLPTYLGEEGIASGSGFWLVRAMDAMIGPHGWTGWIYLAGACALTAALALRVSFGQDRGAEEMLSRLYWLILAFLLLLSPAQPWYWLLLLPFVVLSGQPAAWVATIACVILYDVASDVPELDFMTRDTVFNLAVLGTLLAGLLRRPARAGAVAADGPSR